MINNLERFQKELEQLINKYSLENGSNTPDFILAEYLTRSLISFNMINSQREKWYGKSLSINTNETKQSNT